MKTLKTHVDVVAMTKFFSAYESLNAEHQPIVAVVCKLLFEWPFDENDIDLQTCPDEARNFALCKIAKPKFSELELGDLEKSESWKSQWKELPQFHDCSRI